MDRLKDLKKDSVAIPIQTHDRAGLAANDTMSNRGPPPGAGLHGGTTKASTTQFFNDIDMLKKNVSSIKEANERLKDLTQEAILATSDEKEAELNEEINQLLNASNKKADFTKKMLQGLKAQNNEILSADQQHQNAELRIRDNLLSTLTRKFVEVMKDYQKAQSAYKTEIVKKTRRQIQIIKPEASDDEIESIVRAGGADQLIQQNILSGDANESVKVIYESVTQRHHEMIQIEKSVQEMHQMFVDFALIVEQQGELLDSIEFQVGQTLEHIEAGNVQLTQAINIYKNIRRTQCYCALAFIIVAGIIVGIAVAVAGKKNNSN